MQTIWFTYRIKVNAVAGTFHVQEALDALVKSAKIEAYECIRATPAKESK